MVGPNFRVGKKIGCGNFGELRLGEKGHVCPHCTHWCWIALASSSCSGRSWHRLWPWALGC